MPKLITRCLSQDYQTVTDNHDDNDRGDLDLEAFTEALVYASYIMPYSDDAESPHRPAVGVMIEGKLRPTFFYTSDYQGHFSLTPEDYGQFNADDILKLVTGQASIDSIQTAKAESSRKMGRNLKIVLGFILLIALYLGAAPFFGG